MFWRIFLLICQSLSCFAISRNIINVKHVYGLNFTLAPTQCHLPGFMVGGWFFISGTSPDQHEDSILLKQHNDLILQVKSAGNVSIKVNDGLYFSLIQIPFDNVWVFVGVSAANNILNFFLVDHLYQQQRDKIIISSSINMNGTPQFTICTNLCKATYKLFYECGLTSENITFLDFVASYNFRPRYSKRRIILNAIFTEQYYFQNYAQQYEFVDLTHNYQLQTTTFLTVPDLKEWSSIKVAPSYLGHSTPQNNETTQKLLQIDLPILKTLADMTLTFWIKLHNKTQDQEILGAFYPHHLFLLVYDQENILFSPNNAAAVPTQFSDRYWSFFSFGIQTTSQRKDYFFVDENIEPLQSVDAYYNTTQVFLTLFNDLSLTTPSFTGYIRYLHIYNDFYLSTNLLSFIKGNTQFLHTSIYCLSFQLHQDSYLISEPDYAFIKADLTQSTIDNQVWQPPSLEQQNSQQLTCDYYKGFVLQMNQCKCPSNLFFNLYDNSCLPCHFTCLACANFTKNSCQVCKYPLLLQNSTCICEQGFIYDGFNCHTICGDGIKAQKEECDDGDLENNDGCSATCTIEQQYYCFLDNNNKSLCSISNIALHAFYKFNFTIIEIIFQYDIKLFIPQDTVCNRSLINSSEINLLEFCQIEGHILTLFLDKQSKFLLVDNLVLSFDAKIIGLQGEQFFVTTQVLANDYQYNYPNFTQFIQSSNQIGLNQQSIISFQYFSGIALFPQVQLQFFDTNNIQQCDTLQRAILSFNTTIKLHADDFCAEGIYSFVIYLSNALGHTVTKTFTVDVKLPKIAYFHIFNEESTIIYLKNNIMADFFLYQWFFHNNTSNQLEQIVSSNMDSVTLLNYSGSIFCHIYNQKIFYIAASTIIGPTSSSSSEILFTKNSLFVQSFEDSPYYIFFYVGNEKIYIAYNVSHNQLVSFEQREFSKTLFTIEKIYGRFKANNTYIDKIYILNTPFYYQIDITQCEFYNFLVCFKLLNGISSISSYLQQQTLLALLLRYNFFQQEQLGPFEGLYFFIQDINSSMDSFCSDISIKDNKQILDKYQISQQMILQQMNIWLPELTLFTQSCLIVYMINIHYFLLKLHVYDNFFLRGIYFDKLNENYNSLLDKQLFLIHDIQYSSLQNIFQHNMSLTNDQPKMDIIIMEAELLPFFYQALQFSPFFQEYQYFWQNVTLNEIPINQSLPQLYILFNYKNASEDILVSINQKRLYELLKKQSYQNIDSQQLELDFIVASHILQNSFLRKSIQNEDAALVHVSLYPDQQNSNRSFILHDKHTFYLEPIIIDDQQATQSCFQSLNYSYIVKFNPKQLTPFILYQKNNIWRDATYFFSIRSQFFSLQNNSFQLDYIFNDSSRLEQIFTANITDVYVVLITISHCVQAIQLIFVENIYITQLGYASNTVLGYGSSMILHLSVSGYLYLWILYLYFFRKKKEKKSCFKSLFIICTFQNVANTKKILTALNYIETAQMIRNNSLAIDQTNYQNQQELFLQEFFTSLAKLDSSYVLSNANQYKKQLQQFKKMLFRTNNARLFIILERCALHLELVGTLARMCFLPKSIVSYQLSNLLFKYTLLQLIANIVSIALKGLFYESLMMIIISYYFVLFMYFFFQIMVDKANCQKNFVKWAAIKNQLTNDLFQKYQCTKRERILYTSFANQFILLTRINFTIANIILSTLFLVALHIGIGIFIKCSLQWKLQISLLISEICFGFLMKILLSMLSFQLFDVSYKWACICLVLQEKLF